MLNVFERVLGVCLDVAVAGAERRHAPAAVGEQRARLAALVGGEEARQQQQRRDSASHRMRSAKPAKPLVGSSSSPETATPPRIAASCARRRHSKPTANSLRVSRCMTSEHRDVGAAQRDPGAGDAEAGAAARHEHEQQHDVDGQPGGGRRAGCAMVTRARPVITIITW